jgi:hypothetical protein
MHDYSVIIARLGSRFAADPESPRITALLGYGADWLVGSGKNTALCWGTGDQNGSYIEIRDISRPGDTDGSEDGTLAFDVNLTLRKTLLLRYNVWFIHSPTFTINAMAGSEIDGHWGLIAEGGTYKLYGTFFQTGGQNPARHAAKIVVMKGNEISRSALSPDDTGFITAVGSNMIINNKGRAERAEKVDYGCDSISGHCNWDLFQP